MTEPNFCSNWDCQKPIIMAVFFIWQDFILLVFGIWLIAVSVVLYRIFALFNKLTKGVEAADLKKILEKVITQEAKNEKDINDLLKT